MKIKEQETKFKLGDEVWFMENNKTKKCIIHRIVYEQDTNYSWKLKLGCKILDILGGVFSQKEDYGKTTYYVWDDKRNLPNRNCFCDEEIFYSKEELIKSFITDKIG